MNTSFIIKTQLAPYSFLLFISMGEVDANDNIEEKGIQNVFISYTTASNNKEKSKNRNQKFLRIDTQNSSDCDTSVPENIYYTDRKATSITIEWDKINGEYSYICNYKKAKTEDNWTTTTVNENKITLTDLEKSTKYEFRVKRRCQNRRESNFSETYMFSTPSKDGYCISNSKAKEEFLIHFKLSTPNDTISYIDNRSNRTSKVGYQNFTDNIEMNLMYDGERYRYYIRSLDTHAQGYNAEFHELYIDFNNDNDFNDSGERIRIKKHIYISKGFNYKLTTKGSFSLPDNFVEGKTRLRVITRNHNDKASTCGGFKYGGEVEDYTVVLKEINLYFLNSGAVEAEEGDYLVFDLGLKTKVKKDVFIRARTKHITTKSNDFVENGFEYSLDDGISWNKNDEVPGLIAVPEGYEKLKIRLPTNGDDLFEPNNDSLHIELTPYTYPLVLKTKKSGIPISGLGIIKDNDDAPIISLKEGPKTTEGELMTVTATLNFPYNYEVRINKIRLTPRSADTSDYDESSITLPIIFEPGDTVKTFTIQTIGDRLAEYDETFIIELSDVSNAIINSTSVTTATILNYYLPPLILSLKQNPKVNEGELMTVTATLNFPYNDEVTINKIRLTPKSADTSDYDESSITLPIIFEPGDTVKTFTIQTIEDRLVENDETFTIELSDVSNATIDLTSVTTATILDDDLPLILSLEQNPKVNEGELMTVTATLNRPYNYEVTINKIRLTPKSADTSDYDESSIMLPIIFEPGDIVKTFTIQTIEDRLVENDETFTIELSDVSNASIGFGSTIGTIIDDDFIESKCVSIFPNPFTYHLYIDILKPVWPPHAHPPIDHIYIIIYSELGKTGYQHHFPKHKYRIHIHPHELRYIAKGIHYITVSTPECTSTSKIIRK